MTPQQHGRTFIFDSNENDLIGGYNDVEAAFFSSDDSDSSVTTSSSSSTTTSSSSSSGSDSEEDSSPDHHHGHGDHSSSNQPSFLHSFGRRNSTSNAQGSGYSNNQNSNASGNSTGKHRKSKAGASFDDANLNSPLKSSTTGSLFSLKNQKSELPLHEPPKRPGQYPVGFGQDAGPSTLPETSSRRMSTASIHSYYSMHSDASGHSSKSNRSTKSQRRADPLHRLKNILKSKSHEHDLSDSDDGYDSECDYYSVRDDRSDRLQIDGEDGNYYEHTIAEDDGEYEDSDAVEIKVGSSNEKPQGIMMPPQNNLDAPAPSVSAQNFHPPILATSKRGSGIDHVPGPVTIEEPVVPTSKLRHRKKGHRKTTEDGEESSGQRDSETENGRGHRQRKQRNRLKRVKSHRHYSQSMTSTSAAAARRRAGWDPGIDIRYTQAILQSIGSVVTIVDYNATRYRVIQTEVHPEEEEPTYEYEDGEPEVVPGLPRNKKNFDFYHHLDNRPEWSSVRWISVNGLSWETISAISQRFQLHRLAIEDMVEIPQRTKADMYPSHIFCVMPMHKLVFYKPNNNSSSSSNGTNNNPGSDSEHIRNTYTRSTTTSYHHSGSTDGADSKPSWFWYVVPWSLAEWVLDHDIQIPGTGFFSRLFSGSSHEKKEIVIVNSATEMKEMNSSPTGIMNSPPPPPPARGLQQEQNTEQPITNKPRSHSTTLNPFAHSGSGVSKVSRKFTRKVASSYRAGVRQMTNLYDSDSSSTNSSDTEDESSRSLSWRLSKQEDKTIYDWNNTYMKQSSYTKTPAFMEKKRPLAKYRRAVGVEQVSLFLTNQKTVISFFERSAPDIERPLLARLSTKSTMLRESCDPSMLLQAIVDIIVDQAQPIVTAYRRRFTELEVDAMVTPTMSHTQDLHLMAAELSLLSNTILPISTLVQSLRDHAPQAVAHKGSTAIYPLFNSNNGANGNNSAHATNSMPGSGSSHKSSAQNHAASRLQSGTAGMPISNINRAVNAAMSMTGLTNAKESDALPTRAAPSRYLASQGPDAQVNVRDFIAAGLSNKNSSAGVPASSGPGINNERGSPPSEPPTLGISPLAKLYLGDIGDHLFSYTQDLDMMRENTQNMIEMIFNTIFYQSGQGVNQLTFVTVVFMPLTFWTSYFGQNFESFSWLERGTNLFWIISIPFTVGLLALIMIWPIYELIVRMFRRLRKQWQKRQHKIEKKLIKRARKRDISSV